MHDPTFRQAIAALGTRGLSGELIELHLIPGQVRITLSHGLYVEKLTPALDLAAGALS